MPWKCCGNAVEMPWKCCGNGRGNAVEMLWKWRGNGVEMLWKCCGNAVEMLWKCRGNAVEMLWKCCGNAAEMPWKCCGHAVDMPWKCCGNAVEMLCSEQHGTTTGITQARREGGPSPHSSVYVRQSRKLNRGMHHWVYAVSFLPVCASKLRSTPVRVVPAISHVFHYTDGNNVLAIRVYSPSICEGGIDNQSGWER